MKKLKDIKNLLSRDEMRQIQGGSGTGGCIPPTGLCSRDYYNCCEGQCRGSGYWGLCYSV